MQKLTPQKADMVSNRGRSGEGDDVVTVSLNLSNFVTAGVLNLHIEQAAGVVCVRIVQKSAENAWMAHLYHPQAFEALRYLHVS